MDSEGGRVCRYSMSFPNMTQTGPVLSHLGFEPVANVVNALPHPLSSREWYPSAEDSKLKNDLSLTIIPVLSLL